MTDSPTAARWDPQLVAEVLALARAIPADADNNRGPTLFDTLRPDVYLHHRPRVLEIARERLTCE
jgi:hypothetical protein